MDYYLAAPHSYLVARIYVVSYLNFDGILKDFFTVSEGPYSVFEFFEFLLAFFGIPFLEIFWRS